MAEGFSRTIQAGSDAVIEVSCTPCEEDGSVIKATTFCPICDQHFCPACSKCHARLPATKTHTVTDVHSTGQQTLKGSKAVPVAKCMVHQDRNIELYCGQHNMVYCALCVAMDHRACTGVIEVTDAITPKMSQSDLQSLLRKIKDLESQLQESKKRKELNIQQVESKENDLLEAIEIEYKLLIQHMDKLKEAAITHMKETREQVVVNIKKEISEAAGMEKSLQTCMSHLSSSGKLSKSQTFIYQILGQNTVVKAESLLSSLNSYKSKHIEVDVNKNIRDSVLSATNIAQAKEKTIIDENDAKTPPKIENIIDVNVKVQGDTKVCSINGITQLPDGTILICDYSNKKLKRLDNQWKVRDFCILDSEPWGVCCTGDNEVAVKMLIKTVQFISVGHTLSFTRQFGIRGGGILGMECIFGQLWVPQRDSINVYSMSGSLLFNVKNVGSINRSPQQVSGSGDTVYVSGLHNQIVCLAKEGSLKSVLKDENLGWTRGVCVLKGNIVCAAGFGSDKIVMFAKDGKSLGELVGSGQGIKKPWALCCDKKGHNLIIGCKNRNKIKVLSFEL